MSLLKEFKEFALKGNVVDMAVGVVIGSAFSKIVSSLVADVITPPLGILINGVDFTSLNIVIKQGAAGVPPVTLNYGKFVQTIFDFLIMAAALFSIIKFMNRIKAAAKLEDNQAAPSLTLQEQLLLEIRDVLKQKNMH